MTFEEFLTVNMKICVLCQVVTTPCCGLAVLSFAGSSRMRLIGRKRINIPEIFSGVHGFMGKTLKPVFLRPSI